MLLTLSPKKNILLKNLSLILAFTCVVFTKGDLHAQTNTCVEIESILVDACVPGGTAERENEMMRFLIGPNPQNISSMNITFGYLQSFSGIITPNVSTAAKVAALNATIQSCGLLKEPENGVLPANSKVLFITSLNVNAISNPFTNLTDTLFVIFQNPNTFQPSIAFFINYAAPGTTSAPDLQTTKISFGPGCQDQVTYERPKLIRQDGSIGAQDGATVNFNFQGTATYINNGCQAPFEPLSAAWNPPASICQTAAPLNLSNLITGSSGGTFSGSGINGNTFNPAGLSGLIAITYQVERGNCTEQETKNIQVVPLASAAWNLPAAICAGDQPLNLADLVTGTPGGTFSGTGVNGNTFSPALLDGPVQITYSAGAPGCGDQQTKTIQVTNVPKPVVAGNQPWCADAQAPSLQVTNAGNAAVNWYADQNLNNLLASGASFEPTVSQNTKIYVTNSLNNCKSEALAVDLVIKPVPAIPAGDTLIFYCENQAIPTLTVNGSGTIKWFRDQLLNNQLATGSTFQPSDTSNHNIWVNNTVDGCVSGALNIRIRKIELQQVSISLSGPQPLCKGDSVILLSSSPINNTWSTGETSQQIVVKAEALITLTVNSSCGTGADTVQVEARPVSVELQASTDSSEVPFELVLSGSSINEDSCTWYRNGQVFSYNSGVPLNITEAGNYSFKLLCKNAAGCFSSDSVTVLATNNKIVLVIPNVFTPDGDGINDLFKFELSGYEKIDGVIFNRWGKKIYEWSGLQPDWDGKINGNEATQGVYFYIITGKDILGKEAKQNGTLTLLRK